MKRLTVAWGGACAAEKCIFAFRCGKLATMYSIQLQGHYTIFEIEKLKEIVFASHGVCCYDFCKIIICSHVP